MKNEGPRTSPIQTDPPVGVFPEGLESITATLRELGAMTPEARSTVEQYLHEQEQLLLQKGHAIDADPNLTADGKKILRRELKTALLKNGKAVQASISGMATGESVLSALTTAHVEQMLFEGSFAKLASPELKTNESGLDPEVSGSDHQTLTAPQYGAKVADLAQQQQDIVDATLEGKEQIQSLEGIEPKTYAEIEALLKENLGPLSAKIRSEVRVFIKNQDLLFQSYYAQVEDDKDIPTKIKMQYRIFDGLVSARIADVMDANDNPFKSGEELLKVLVRAEKTMQELKDKFKLPVFETQEAKSGTIVDEPIVAIEQDGDDSIEPLKKSLAAGKVAVVEVQPNEPKATEDPEVRKFFEEEYYELRDTNKLARGADGHVMSPDEYVASKIAELDALTPAGETISIPDATQKEVLTALQKSITAERERLSDEAVRMGAAQAQAANPLDTQSTPLTDVKSRLATLSEKLTGKSADEDAPKLSAAQLYELRAQGIAEKNGMGDHFKEVRFIRQAYIDARAAIGKSADKDKVKELKLSYDRALYGWRRDLEQKAGGLSGLEKAELLVVAKRDTILGPANAEIEARESALTEKGKTAFGKVQNWMTRAPVSVLKGLNWAPTKIGEGIASVFNKNAYQPNVKMSPEKYRELAALTPTQREELSAAAQQDAARNYARAARIIAGAGIATVITVMATPVAGVGGILLPLVVFTARGTAGTLAGMGGAKLGGVGFDFFNRNRRADLKSLTSATPTTLEEYQAQQKAYQKNNSRRRATEKMGTQMVGAILVGGGTGILSSGISHSILEHFGGLSSVKEAAKTVADVNAHSPNAGPEAMRVGAAVKAAAAHPVEATPHAPSVTEAPSLSKAPAEAVTASGPSVQTAPSIASAAAKAAEASPVRVSVPTAPEGLLTSVAINKPGEGFGQLLVDLRHQVSGLENPPAGLKHFLEQNPNALTHRLGVAESGGSLRMHAGDKLFIDAKQNVWLQAQGQEHPTLVFQKVPVSAEAPDGYRVEHLDIKKFGGELQSDAVRPRAPEARVVQDAPVAPRSAVVPPEAVRVGTAVPEVVTATTERVATQTFESPGTLDTLHQPSALDADVPPTRPSVAVEPPPEAPKPTTSVTLEQSAASATVPEQGGTASASVSVDALPQDMVPFTNSHGVDVVPTEPRVYALPGQRLVIWGTDSFQKQLDAAHAFIDEQRELGKHVTVLLERTRENPFTGARETTMYEFNTDIEDTKIYPPDELPIKPFDAKDFVPK